MLLDLEKYVYFLKVCCVILECRQNNYPIFKEMLSIVFYFYSIYKYICEAKNVLNILLGFIGFLHFFVCFLIFCFR